MIWAFWVLTMILTSCNNAVPNTDSNLYASKNEGRNKKDYNEKNQGLKDENNTQILNDISIETKEGVEVEKTFLSYENDDLVPSSNVTSLRKPIYLNLNIKKGWKEEAGEVLLGASEKISTSDGTVLLDEADLFQKDKSISADNAKFIRLKAVVNRISPLIKYFIVDYKVWDKSSNGSIKDSYKFYVE